METLETQLERVQEAIRTIEEGAQEYQLDNRRITRANLATLYRREIALKREIARQVYGNTFYAHTGRL